MVAVVSRFVEETRPDIDANKILDLAQYSYSASIIFVRDRSDNVLDNRLEEIKEEVTLAERAKMRQKREVAFKFEDNCNKLQLDLSFEDPDITTRISEYS